MKVCVVGAGSIGGYLVARLAGAGNDVTVIARGGNLAAIKARGLRLVTETGDEVARPALVTDKMADAGTQDVVILTMKAHQVEAILPDLPALLDNNTMIVPMQNGIPWWYFMHHGGEHEGRYIRTVDPSGAIATSIGAKRVIGCVVYPACQIVEPGVIRHIEGNRFPIGELDGAVTSRAERLSALFEAAGLKAPVLDDIRSELWLKLWGNLTFNPLSALTRATLDRICADPHTRQLAVNMMTEAQAIAGKLGITFRVPLERRIDGAAKVGRHKTSMLQDIEAGRETEIEALVGSVIELAQLTGTPVPHIEMVYACTRLLQGSVSAPAPAATAPEGIAATIP
jgi:2-dehydropantoate 2-reductase